jgi:hypothetical protein
MIDTRRREVAVLDSKRAQMIKLLGEWTTRANFNLRDISSLHGSLEILMRYINGFDRCFSLFRTPLSRAYAALPRSPALVQSLEPPLIPRGSTYPCATAPAGRAHYS